jgi:predicted nucleic acid-binding Zn ribbon protein
MAERNWAAWGESLQHPDGPAVWGEPCVQCSDPIPPGSHRTWLDRHVCSSRCNSNLKRRHNRRVERGDIELPPPRLPVIVRPRPAYFGTNILAEFPYAYAGLGPTVGDVVDRHGSTTAYLPWLTDDGLVDPLKVLCHHEQTGSLSLVSVDEASMANGILWSMRAIYLPEQDAWVRADPCQRSFRTSDGIEWHWTEEIFRCIDDEGEPYTWWAHICTPTPFTEVLWTPEYAERSARLLRTSRSTAGHRRRERVAQTSTDRIDPLEVFAADGWTCQLCGKSIDQALRHPHPMSASLDHVVPLAAWGTHTRDNVQASHLTCNIRKGARVLAEPTGSK